MMISFNDNYIINSIIEKVNNTNTVLSEMLDISNGFKPYQVGYGINSNGLALKDEDVKRKIYHSEKRLDDNYKKELKGKGVKRYSLQWQENYIKWGSWLMSPKDERYFENPKILIRQIISDYFFATIDTEKYYADQSLYVCINYPNDKTNNLLYYLAILNSTLYGFFFRKFYSQEDDLFPKVKVNELKSLSVKKLSVNEQQPFINKADIMLSKNKVSNQLLQQFTQLLQSKFATININNKLQNWANLTSNEFFKELTKQKIKLPLSEQQEWLQYFEAEKINANSIQQTDDEIDKMVYELYGLSEEEVGIVEQK